MTAAVESVSPAMCRKALRRLTSRATPHSRAAITPFITTPAAATIIMSWGCTADGRAEAVDCLGGDPQGDDDKGGGVDECGQHTCPLVAEGAGVIGGTGLKIDGDKAEQERQKIRDIMAGLGEQGKGVGAQSSNKCHHYVSKGGDERKAQYGLCPFRSRTCGSRMDMHM